MSGALPVAAALTGDILPEMPRSKRAEFVCTGPVVLNLNRGIRCRYTSSMSKTRLKEVGRLLSLVLRHEPAQLGLQLDAQGYVPVDDLLSALAQHGRAIDRDGLAWIVAENNKQRFSFSPDGTRIRANQGHSIPVDLGLMPTEPPERLFHGTAEPFVADILRDGLRAQARQHVHLSVNAETATQVGKRHGPPVLLVVAAGDLFRAGHAFYLAANGVWLADHVPATALRLYEPVS